MSFDSNFKSYLKTTLACLVPLAVAMLVGVLARQWLPDPLGPAVAVLSALAALGFATLVCASAVVLLRYKRATRGEADLFLELNRSREPAAIKAAAAVRTTRLRRWLAQRLLGHDFVVGELVEVKSWPEVRATLDARGCLERLPFMPEMLAMCGQRAYVFRCVHRLFDYRKSRGMRHMNGAVLLLGTVCDGSSHGACEAACHTIWKSAWLRRVEPGNDRAAAAASVGRPVLPEDAAVLQIGTQAPRYVCQLTQLHAASQPIGNWSACNFLRPLISGNVAPAAFVVGWLTHLFNELQQKRGGVGFPAFAVAARGNVALDETQLAAGNDVIVKSSAEIRATLNDQSLNRGLYFDPDMLKHCERRHRVQAEVKKLIDIVTGEVRTMKTPAYILRGVHFSGERQLFNAQHEPLFWRGVWLRRDGD